MAARRRPRGANASGVFGIGDEVEVSCDEEGFVGAWYEATVVRRLRRHRRYSVVYASILSDNDPSRLLQEAVPASHVRPRPPRADGEPIGVHELVEGFHRDGWWPGLVSELRGERYLVSFPATREEVEFPAAKVRRRLLWVKGRWVSPEDEEGPDIVFGVGAEVEVTRDEEAYGTEWYPGTVTKVIGKAYCLVEYKILRPNTSGYNGGGSLLREIVDPQYIRPSPPDFACEKNFHVQDEVEALLVDKWLVGVISRVLAGSRYIVKLEHKDEELEFDQSVLRLRHDWVDGQWTHIFMDHCRKSAIAHRTNSGCKLKAEVGKGSSVIVSESKSNPGGCQTANEPHSDDMFPECEGATVRQKLQVRRRCNFPDSVSKVAKNSENNREEKTLEEPISIFLTPKRKKVDEPSLEGQSKSSQSWKKSKKEEQCHSESHSTEKSAVNPLLESQSKSTQCQNKSKKEECPSQSHPNKGKGTVSSQLEDQSTFPESQKKSKMDENHPSESLSKEKNPASPKLGSKSSPNVDSEGRVYEVFMHKLQHLTTILIDGSKLEEKENQSKQMSLNLSPPNEGTSDVLTAEPKKLGSARGSTASSKVQRKRVVIRVPNQRKPTFGLEVRQLQTGKTRVGRRGRPSKKNIIHANAASQCVDDGKLETAADLVVEREATMEEVEPQALNYACVLSHEMESPCLGNASLKHEYSIPKADVIGNVSIDRINRRLKILDSWNLSNHAEPMGPQSNCPMEGDGMSNLPLKKPLAKPMQCSLSGAIIQAPCQEDGASLHKKPTCNGSASERRIVEVDGASMKLSHSNSSVKEKILSSVKNSPMWKSIESMEAFRMMPQQPHFYPLELHCEELRDGMAIGFMVAFANLITNIRKLRIDDPKEEFESRLKALIPLEANGFDVRCLRSRIERLLEIKTNQGQCEFQKVRLKGQILDRNNENIRIDTAMAELDKAIEEVEKSLAQVNERKNSIIIQRKANDVEIKRMQMDLQAAEEAYVVADSNFCFAQTAPW